MRKKPRARAVSPDETRRGYFGGVYGASYALTGGYLNPDQFGYSTAQDPDGDGDSDVAASSSSGGTAAAGGGTA